MTPEKVFRIANTIVLLPWLLMMIVPHAEITKTVINSNGFPLVLAVLYGFYIVKTFGKSGGNFFTLAGVEKLFSKREVLLAAWIHYLVFDLFVGAWEWRDALQNNISQWFLVPCLILTLMFGPVGYLLYFGLRVYLVGMPF
jgi:hypothetical protein